jgi:hypothetical protein
VDPWHSLTRVGQFVRNIELRYTDTDLEDGSRIFDEKMLLQRAAVFHDAEEATRSVHNTIVVERFRYGKAEDIPRIVALVDWNLQLLDQLMSKGHATFIEIHPRFAQCLCGETLNWVKSKRKPQVEVIGK